MSVLGTCVLLCMLALSAKGFVPRNSEKFQFFAVEPSGVKKCHQKKTLTIRSLLDRRGIFDKVTKMEILMFSPGDEMNLLSIAVVNEDGPSKSSAGPYGSKYDVTGGLNLSLTQQLTSLEVQWKSEYDGYCRTYISRVIGVPDNGQTDHLTKVLEVGPRAGSTCTKKKELQSNPGAPGPRHDEMPKGGRLKVTNLDVLDEDEDDQSKPEIPGYIKAAFPDATSKQQQQILNKINSIDKNTYEVSDIYQGRVYIASMKEKRFELHKMNELCKSAGGYLVEMDSLEEQHFVRDFLEKTVGHFRYFTGANDVDYEGNFVYYNSKKPVTNVEWLNGQPNNWKGNENCVEILPGGLNDSRCTRIRGYICEIPLLDRPAAERA